jgi:hypothetical protein
MTPKAKAKFEQAFVQQIRLLIAAIKLVYFWGGEKIQRVFPLLSELGKNTKSKYCSMEKSEYCPTEK